MVMVNLFLWSKVYSLFRCMRSLSEEPLICRWMLKAVYGEGVSGEQCPWVIPLHAPGRRRSRGLLQQSGFLLRASHQLSLNYQAASLSTTDVKLCPNQLCITWNSGKGRTVKVFGAYFHHVWVPVPLWNLNFTVREQTPQTLLPFLLVAESSPIHVPHSRQKETLKRERCLISRYVPVRLWA